MRFLARRRAVLLFLALLALLGALASRSRGGAVPAAERAFYAAVEGPLESAARLRQRTSGRLGEIFRRQRLSDQVAELEARLAAAELDRTELEDARLENQRLAALLDLKQRTPGTVRAARVIASEVSGTLRSVVIDAGARDGVSKDAAVLAADGLVGRVLRTGDRTSVVQLVADAASGLGVLDERSRVQGVLVGTGSGRCRLKYVPNLEDVRAGDRIVASGLDGIYPKGFLVGVVAQAAPGPDAFQAIQVDPAARLDRLETVLVFVRPEAAGSARLQDGLAAAREPSRAPGRTRGRP
jgi:rod shape-determining protein MreC